jgi:hypothetical protein
MLQHFVKIERSLNYDLLKLSISLDELKETIESEPTSIVHFIKSVSY